MNLLITGSTGFIGSALVRELTNDYKLFTASSSETDRPNHLQIDLRDENATEKLPSKIDCVIHLIQSKNYGTDPENNLELFETNLQGTFRLLEWSRKNGVSRFILASSGNVYNWGKELLNEESSKNPNSFYGATKLCAEVLAKQYSNFFDIVALRLFTVYGPNQDAMLIPGLRKKLLEGSTISIQGGTGPTFSPLYIEDCVQFIRRAIQVSLPTKFLALNLSGSEILSIKEIVETLSEIHGLTPNYTHPEGEPQCYASNSKLAHQVLGYSPKFNFSEGAKKSAG